MKRIQGKRGKGFKNEITIRQIKITDWKHQNQNELNSKKLYAKNRRKKRKGIQE